MIVSTRTGQKSEYTDAFLKRLGLGQPMTPMERKRIKQEREEYKQALRSAGGLPYHCCCRKR